jgi:hypothetical protein
VKDGYYGLLEGNQFMQALLDPSFLRNGTMCA